MKTRCCTIHYSNDKDYEKKIYINIRKKENKEHKLWQLFRFGPSQVLMSVITGFGDIGFGGFSSVEVEDFLMELSIRPML